jgi:hypothetical protein
VFLDYYMLVGEPAQSQILSNRRLWEFSNAANWKRIAVLIQPAGR